MTLAEEPASASTTCLNHPDKPATHTCYRCNRRFCFDCIDIIKGRYVCAGCDTEATETAPAVAKAAPTGNVVRPPDRPITVGGPRLALFLGTLFGVFGLGIWEKVSLATASQVAVVNLGVGFGIGLGVASGSKKRGWQSSTMAVLIAVVIFTVGHVMLIHDAALAAAIKNQTAPPAFTLSLFTMALSKFPISHWMQVVLGIGTAGIVGVIAAPSGIGKPPTTPDAV